MDDTVIFINNDTNSVLGIKYIMDIFHLLSGLKVKFYKSVLYGYFENSLELESWVKILGCKIGTGDCTYFGANVSASSRSIKFRDPHRKDEEENGKLEVL